MLPQSFYDVDPVTLSKELLGCELIFKSPEGICSGIIVETEAYHQSDEASHSFKGKTKRNEVMFGPPGHAYIYFTYGMHHCFNIVAGAEGEAGAALIRALEPTQGIELMQPRRKTTDPLNLCSGPAKLVQAMGLAPTWNGSPVFSDDLHVLGRKSVPNIVESPRIGISTAKEKPWRFFITDNPYITKHKFNRAAVLLEGE